MSFLVLGSKIEDSLKLLECQLRLPSRMVERPEILVRLGIVWILGQDLLEARFRTVQPIQIKLAGSHIKISLCVLRSKLQKLQEGTVSRLILLQPEMISPKHEVGCRQTGIQFNHSLQLLHRESIFLVGGILTRLGHEIENLQLVLGIRSGV